MRIPQNIIDEINQKTDIVALVSPYVQLTKKGKNFMGVCPFHDDKSPSFSVSPEKHLAKCMACGEGGNPITFYQKIKNISFEEAVRDLAQPLGIKLDITVKNNPDKVEHLIMKDANQFYTYYLTHSETGKKALEYLHKRGLTDEMIAHFEIGLAPKGKDALSNILLQKKYDPMRITDAGVSKLREDGSLYDLMSLRITFPITDAEGRIVGFSGRALEDDPVKYLNTPETVIFKKGETIYHLSSALKDIRIMKNVILHEGFFDVMASYRAGFKQAIATMGTALTKSQAQLIKKYAQKVVLAYDGDSAGANATLKALPILESVGLIVEVAQFKDNLDPDDYLQQYGEEAYQMVFKSLLDPLEFTYQFYKNNHNLTNSNDIKSFKAKIINAIKYKDKSVQEIYFKKMASDLNVSYDSVAISETKETHPEIPKNPKSQTLIDKNLKKFYNAEKQLVIAMIKNPEMATRINQALGQEYSLDLDLLKIRAAYMFNYYNKFDEFDTKLFLNILESDLQVAFEQKILASLEWRSIFKFTEEAVTELLDVMKKEMHLKMDYIEQYKEVQSTNEAYTQTISVEKQKKTKKELISRKESKS